MSDLISRQAAIDALEREQSLVERPITETRWFDLGLRKAQDVLSDLPSAERRGHWIFSPSDAIELMSTKLKCSECGFESADGGNYCPNCGAEMRGEAE